MQKNHNHSHSRTRLFPVHAPSNSERMAGGNHVKSSSNKGPSASTSTVSSHRKSRWESPKPPPSDRKSNPSPKPPTPAQSKALADPAHAPFTPPGLPFPFSEPPPPPSYDFHMLDRRTIILADGSVRSYFALPPDYDFTPRPMDPSRRFLHNDFGNRFPLQLSPEGGFRDNRQFWNKPIGGPDGVGPIKRKYGDDMQYANPSGETLTGTSGPMGEESRPSKYMRNGVGGGQSVVKHNYLEVDGSALKKVFLHFVKVINENVAQRKNYLENGKQGRLPCIACHRSSKDFPDMHGLIMHTYNSDNADLRVDHLGLHKALCVLMGWNYSKPPDNSKAYQFLPPDEAAANQDDMIIWPPTVIIHNTVTGKGKDGRMEGLGNKAMDKTIRDLGVGSGKSKSLYGREGHLGITLVKFAGDQSGLRDALHLAEYFEKGNRGRKVWARVQPLMLGKDDENNPNLLKVDVRTGEKQRILYGYLGTANDLDKFDFETRKKVVIESWRELKVSR